MDEPRKDMGVGILAQPTTTFVRKFRWTLESEGLAEFVPTKIKIQFKNRLMTVGCIEYITPELEDIQAQKWAESSLAGKNMIFTTYDGCGNPIYNYTFEGLEIIEDEVEFDYSSSEVSTREVQISFQKYRRQVFQSQRYVNPKEVADERRQN